MGEVVLGCTNGKFLTLHEGVLGVTKCEGDTADHLDIEREFFKKRLLRLTQISTLVVTLLLLYLSIISGGLYIIVVYFS